MIGRTALVTALLAASAVTAACSGGAAEATRPASQQVPASPTAPGAGTSSPASAGPGTSTPTAPVAGTPAPAAAGGSVTPGATGTAVCGQPGGVPAGAARRAMPDVDGDGQAETLWISSDGVHRAVGVTTSRGATFAQPINTGSPIRASALAFKVRRDTGVSVVVSDGRQATLYAGRSCSLPAVTGPDGQPFRFDLGFAGNGTGMGCVDIGGRRELVGLLANPDTRTVKRTVIQLHHTMSDGETATIGASDEVHADRAAMQLARQITCGDLTLKKDGVREPRV